MVRSVWVEEVVDLHLDGEITVISLVADGEPLLLRGKRHTTVTGLALCARRYQEQERAERQDAKVLPFKKRH